MLQFRAYLFVFCALAIAAQELLKLDATRFNHAVPFLVSGKPRKARVVGGEEVDITEYPFVASVRYKNEHICGGSLYTLSWVLTAAHCMFRQDDKRTKVLPEEMRVWMGVNDVRGTTLPEDAQEKGVVSLILHPDYTEDSDHPDIGMMKLTEAFQLTERVELTKLPKTSELGTPPERLRHCHVTGWGFTKPIRPGGPLQGETPKSLMMGELVMISKAECEFILNDALENCMICAGVDKSKGIDACFGDGGGPLVCDETQVGIISLRAGCGWKSSVSTYTSTECFLGWMDEIKAHGGSKKPVRQTMAVWWVMVAVVVGLGVVLAAVLASIILRAVYARRRH